MSWKWLCHRRLQTHSPIPLLRSAAARVLFAWHASFSLDTRPFRLARVLFVYPASLCFGGSIRLQSHGGAFHLSGRLMAKIFLDSLLHQVNKRCENDGHCKLIDVVDQANCQYLLPRPVIPYFKGDIQHHKTVHQLRNHG